MKSLKRMWINQPSTIQFAHELHGKNVLVDIEDQRDGDFVIVYFTEGDATSARVPRIALSQGWIESKPNEAQSQMLDAAPDMLQALRDALQICQIAKQYFPKSIRNSAKFALLNVENNSIRKAIDKATGEVP